MATWGAKRKRGSPARGKFAAKKRRIMVRPKRGSFAKRVKAVSLSQNETKCFARPGSAGSSGTLNLTNNKCVLVNANLLGLTRGVNEDQLTSRIGDEVVARGLRITFTVKCYGLYPDQYYRWYLVKGITGALPTDLPYKSVSGNIMLDCVDTETITVLKSGTFRSHGTNETDLGSNDKTIFKKIWMPLKNKKIRYRGTDVLQYPYEYGLYVGCFYQNFGITNPSQITNQSAFYFKDP